MLICFKRVQDLFFGRILYISFSMTTTISEKPVPIISHINEYFQATTKLISIKLMNFVLRRPIKHPNP